MSGVGFVRRRRAIITLSPARARLPPMPLARFGQRYMKKAADADIYSLRHAFVAAVILLLVLTSTSSP